MPPSKSESSSIFVRGRSNLRIRLGTKISPSRCSPHDGTELFFEEVTGPICASFEMLELGITRFWPAASPAKLLWSLGISP